jgi:FkbM family methyltransferase
MHVDLRDYTQRRIFYESYEPHELAFCERFLRPGDVVLDVGAHVGIFTLLSAAAVGPSGEVHSFEPVPGNFAALRHNVELNTFRNVELNQAAVTAEAGEISLGLAEVSPDSGETSGMFTAGAKARAFNAPAMTLDSYVGEHLDGKPIRLVKIDVEGFEPAALAGFQRCLAVAPPDAILLELNTEALHRHGFRPDDVYERLIGSGYELFRAGGAGKLRRFEPEAGAPAAELTTEPAGLLGLVRRYRAESRLFFNVFALQPGVGR